MDILQKILEIMLGTVMSPLTAVAVALAISFSNRLPPWKKAAAIFLSALVSANIIGLASLHPQAARIFEGTNSPFVGVLILLVFPAVFLPRNRYYRIFLVVPALVLAATAASVFIQYAKIPPGEKGFYWLLIPSWILASAAVSFLIIAEPFFPLGRFRALVRFTVFMTLTYGGFALRQDYLDYKEMLSRRKNYADGILNLSETSPVMSAKGGGNYAYLPSAPCRFTADGGYVQGCNMELFQRLLQLDFVKIRAGEAAEMQFMGKVLGALTLLLAMSLLFARWFCGWACPLSFIGGIADWCRRRLRLPHVKPTAPLKLAYFFSGAGLAGFTLALAKCYPHLDESGRFRGCKIPLYPFCKICPGQQVCPVVSSGLSSYPGIPGWEWMWGFYRVGTVVLLVFFIVSFTAGRRLWCYFCPMGMLSGIFNRGGFAALRKDPVKCNRCGACNEVCPMHIDTVRSEMKNRDVSSFDCVLCLKCVQKCPRDSCLSFELAGRKIAESKFNG